MVILHSIYKNAWFFSGCCRFELSIRPQKRPKLPVTACGRRLTAAVRLFFSCDVLSYDCSQQAIFPLLPSTTTITNYPPTTKLSEGMMCSYLFCKEMKYLSSANTYQEQAKAHLWTLWQYVSSGALTWPRLFLLGHTSAFFSLDFKASKKGRLWRPRKRNR